MPHTDPVISRDRPPGRKESHQPAPRPQTIPTSSRQPQTVDRLLPCRRRKPLSCQVSPARRAAPDRRTSQRLPQTRDSQRAGGYPYAIEEPTPPPQLHRRAAFVFPQICSKAPAKKALCLTFAPSFDFSFCFPIIELTQNQRAREEPASQYTAAPMSGLWTPLRCDGGEGQGRGRPGDMGRL